MRRVIALLMLVGGIAMLSARPANPLSVAADLALILYQKLVSPLQGGGLCNFSPTCSNFSRESYRLFGPFWGTLMTFERLERCNPWAWSLLHVYYPQIRNERLYDPPENHYLPSRLKEQKDKKADQKREEL